MYSQGCENGRSGMAISSVGGFGDNMMTKRPILSGNLCLSYSIINPTVTRRPRSFGATTDDRALFPLLGDHMKLIQSLCTAALAGVFAISAWGQSTATLTGVVTDPSGAVVPNANVTVHSLATGLDRVLVTDGAGIYVAPSLQPGDYKVSVTAAGFSVDT